MSENYMYIVIIIICLILSAYFSATETAFTSLNRIKIKNMAQNGNKKAQRVLNLYEDYDSLLSTILIGNNIVNILSASLATIVFVNCLGNDLGPTISTIVLTIVVLVFGEVSPKTVAKENPEGFSLFSAPIIQIMIKLFTPFNFLFALWKKVLKKIFKQKEDNSEIEAELITMVKEANEEGFLDNDEKDLIQSAIEFGDLTVGEIYTPRIDVTSISKDLDRKEIENIFNDTAFSRLPVYDGEVDKVIGILNYKDFRSQKDKDITDILQPTIFVPKSKNISELLKELQKQKIHISVVIDEYSDMIGIITMEDILEELVGEIWDEHDEVIIDIEKINDNEYILSGYANVEKISNIIGKEIYTDVNTVNGFIMELLGRLPKEKDLIDYENVKIQVISMKDKRIEKVKITKIS